MKKIVIIMSVLFLVGCYEDKGNYDYTTIGNIEISDIKETYASQKYTTLKIMPKIVLTHSDEGNLEYLWEVNGKSISTERNLDYEVMESFQDKAYVCRFTVINRENDTKFSKVFNLKVVTPFYRGLSILSRIENDESMLSYCPHSENDVPGEIIHNVFFNENESKLEGKPLSLQPGDDWDDMDGDLFLNTSKGSYDISAGIMKAATFYDMTKMMTPDKDVDMKGLSMTNYTGSNYGGFVSNGKIHVISDYNPFYSLPSPDPCPINGDPSAFIEDYYLSEYFISRTNNYGSRLGVLAYDNNRGQFLSFNTDMSSTDTEQMAKVTERGTLGLKMFYMGLAEKSAKKHAAIFHNGNYGEWVLIPFLTTNYAINTARFPITDCKLNKDSKVIIETNFSNLYYTSGSKIYMIYLTDTNKEFKSNEITIEGLGNDPIVMLRYKNWTEKVLYIGVVSSGKGKIYEVDMATKKIINTIEGFEGTPIDVFYK